MRKVRRVGSLDVSTNKGMEGGEDGERGRNWRRWRGGGVVGGYYRE